MVFRKHEVVKNLFFGNYSLQVLQEKKDAEARLVKLIREGLFHGETKIHLKNGNLVLQAQRVDQIDQIEIPLDLLAVILKEVGCDQQLVDLIEQKREL